MEKLIQYHRLATVIGYGMIGSLLVFAAIVETLKATSFEGQGFLPSPILEILRYILLGMAVVEFFTIRFVRKLILSRGSQTLALSNRADLLPLKAQKLFTAAIISFAFCESIALYGLVLFLIGGNGLDFYLFTFLSLGCFAFYFPKYPQWEEWATKPPPAL